MLQGIEHQLHTDALAAAEEERMLQLQAAIDFDALQYEVGDRVEWHSFKKNLEGTGILTAIGDPITTVKATDEVPFSWKGSQHVQLEVTECRLKESPKKVRHSSTVVISTFYKKGQFIELRKGEVRRKLRKLLISE